MSDITIGGVSIAPGQVKTIEMPVIRLYTDTDMNMPIKVIRSKQPGPTVFVSAAMHGDELNGVEIIRRLIEKKSFKLASGSLILVPLVNIYGLLNQSRYMPDRRDLNRCFPGSSKGSLSARVANKFIKEVVSQCQYGIDLHTGAIHRSNLPQIRANLSDKETRTLAEAFGVPVLLNASLRDGSLRQAADELGVKVLLYEAGEALRFEELAIRVGLKGVLNILKKLEMLKVSAKSKGKVSQMNPYIANNSSWLRAKASGIVSDKKRLGDKVEKGDVLAEIGSPLGEHFESIIADRSGIIIGKQNIPLVQEGDAMFHIAYFADKDEGVVENIETMQEQMIDDIDRINV